MAVSKETPVIQLTTVELADVKETTDEIHNNNHQAIGFLKALLIPVNNNSVLNKGSGI